METWFAPATALDVALQKASGAPPPGIGDPVGVGSGVLAGSAANPLVITTTADIPAGVTAIVATLATNSMGITSIVDSVGSTWTLNPVVNPGANFLRQAFVKPVSVIPAGTTISITFSGTTGRRLAQAIMCSGLSEHDVLGGGFDSASTTAPVVATPTLTQANDLLLACTFVSAGHLDLWSEDPDWTAVAGAPIVETRILRLAWKKADSTVSENYTPTNAVARAMTSYVDSYKGT